MADADLLVGGRVFGGWENVGITSSMDAAAGAFNLSVTDRWGADPRPIQVGEACEVRADGETVIRGWVDICRPRVGARSHSIEVQGRDRCGDMIDCSAVHEPDEWRGLGLLELANILGAPFGVTAAAEVDLGAPFPLVKLQQAETAMEALLRYARARKVLVMPDGAGGLLLTRTSSRRAAVELVEGQNCLSLDGSQDWSDRFSSYTVKAQGNYSEDSSDGAAEAHVLARAADAYVTRYRPLIVIADADSLSESSALERATWEANSRLGRSAQATVAVLGWRQNAGGALWRPNTLVKIRSPSLQLDGEMMVRQVTLSRGPGGTVASLDCVSPQAYDPMPPDGTQPRSLKKKDRANPWIEALGIEGEPDA